MRREYGKPRSVTDIGAVIIVVPRSCSVSEGQHLNDSCEPLPPVSPLLIFSPSLLVAATPALLALHACCVDSNPL